MVTAEGLRDLAHGATGVGSSGCVSGLAGAGSAGTGSMRFGSVKGSKTISRRIGPICPARMRATTANLCDLTSDEHDDGIGITPYAKRGPLRVPNADAVDKSRLWCRSL